MHTCAGTGFDDLHGTHSAERRVVEAAAHRAWGGHASGGRPVVPRAPRGHASGCRAGGTSGQHWLRIGEVWRRTRGRRQVACLLGQGRQRHGEEAEAGGSAERKIVLLCRKDKSGLRA